MELQIATNKFIFANSLPPEILSELRRAVAHVTTIQERDKSEDRLLELLPRETRITILTHARIPLLRRHILMVRLHVMFPRVIAHLCAEGISDGSYLRGDTIFTKGDASSTMYFVSKGSLFYNFAEDEEDKYGTDDVSKSAHLMAKFALATKDTKNPFGSQRVTATNWLSEAAIWTIWTHVGGCRVISRKRVKLLLVDSHAMKTTILKYRDAYHEVLLYGLYFVEMMNRYICTDIGVKFDEIGMQSSPFEPKWSNQEEQDDEDRDVTI